MSLCRVKKISATGTIILGCFIALAYPLFVHLTMSDNTYQKTIPIFYILFIGYSFLAFIAPYRGFLSMIDMPEEHLKIRIISLIINIFLNITLIYKYDLLGAAIASTLSNIIFVLMLNHRIHEKLNESI